MRNYFLKKTYNKNITKVNKRLLPHDIYKKKHTHSIALNVKSNINPKT